MMTEEHFKEIWKECRENAHSNGNLFIDDWTVMCYAIGEYSEENGIDHPDDGSIFTDERHKAFIKGAQWAFNYLKSQSDDEEIDLITDKNANERYGFTSYGKKEDWE